MFVINEVFFMSFGFSRLRRKNLLMITELIKRVRQKNVSTVLEGCR